MNLPLQAYELISPQENLLAALMIGLAFGFILEKGGLGHAIKLVNQFLLKDLTVFKVMFSVIITAMTGLFFLSVTDQINLDLIQLPETHWLPQLVGGFLLGVGFAVAGYCPGTTLVGMATGKLDALFCFVGLISGSLLFVMMFNSIAPFYFSTSLGDQKLNDWIALSSGGILFVTISLAISCFVIAEKIEVSKSISTPPIVS